MNKTYTNIKIAAGAIIILGAMSVQPAFSQTTSPTPAQVGGAVTAANTAQAGVNTARTIATPNQERAEDRLNNATINQSEANAQQADVNADPNSTPAQRASAQGDVDSANIEFDFANGDAQLNGNGGLRAELAKLRAARAALDALYEQLVNDKTKNGAALRRMISRCLRATKPKTMVAMFNPGRNRGLVAMGNTRNAVLAGTKGGHTVKHTVHHSTPRIECAKPKKH